MKERYEVPEMEIVEFETEDIITTSGDPRRLLYRFPKNNEDNVRRPAMKNKKKQ